MWYPMSSKIPVDTVTHFHTDKNNLLSRLDILVECMQLLICQGSAKVVFSSHLKTRCASFNNVCGLHLQQ